MRVEFGPDERAGRSVAGVDTHSQEHWLCVLGEHGERLLSERFGADGDGVGALVAALGDPAGVLAVGVEGTSSYGAALTRALLDSGFRVFEVTRPRRERRGARKSDASDAERAARRVLTCEGLSHPKSRDGWVESLRALLAARERLVSARTAASNAALALARTAPAALRALLPAGGAALMRACAGLPEGAAGCPDHALALRELAGEWEGLGERAERLAARIAGIVERNCPALLRVYGCGPISAAALLAAAGDNPGRIGGEAAFAALCGAAPEERSSGKSSRVRAGRGGDRRANRALHEIARARMRHDPETRAYGERRAKMGKGERDAERCVARYAVREVWRAIRDPFGDGAAREGASLAAARRAAGLRQLDVALLLGTSQTAVCQVERGRRSPRGLLARYREWVALGCPVDGAAFGT